MSWRLFDWTGGHGLWWDLLLILHSPGRDKALRGHPTVCVCVSRVCSCLFVCIWMCLRRQSALLFAQITIWHRLHGLWSAFHPIWTINVAAIHQPVSMCSPHGTSVWLVQSFYNSSTHLIVPHYVHHGLNKLPNKGTAYIRWQTCTNTHLSFTLHFPRSPSNTHGSLITSRHTRH